MRYFADIAPYSHHWGFDNEYVVRPVLPSAPPESGSRTVVPVTAGGERKALERLAAERAQGNWPVLWLLDQDREYNLADLSGQHVIHTRAERCVWMEGKDIGVIFKPENFLPPATPMERWISLHADGP